ncbi:MAG TPA: HEAT repeat domain-containing protein [Gemmataceae bacterium]|nr:HEAT repeat domain-containing protein [Gemmataceae bacterium]
MLSTRAPTLVRAGIGAALALLLVPALLLAQSSAIDFAKSPAFKRRAQMTEAELLAQLRSLAVEVDVHEGKRLSYVKQLVDSVRPAEPAQGQARRRSSPVHTLAVLKAREDLKDLPLVGEPDCNKTAAGARLMEKVSKSVRDSVAEYLHSSDASLAVRHVNENGLLPPLASVAELYSRPQITTLMQMFQPQGPGVRKKLVELLAEWEDPQASVMLAQRAVFDLSPEVRAAAVAALRKRPGREFRQVLIDALRYPWPPVADHAAEALVAIRDWDATGALLSLLDKQDPRRPYFDDKKRPVKAELVAVNHLRNCLLCHAPSFDNSDPGRGAVPDPLKPLASRYYDSDGIFARADVTYLKQDFSAFQPVPDAKPWPKEQRFDYLVRYREVAAADVASTNEEKTYPQREAVLFALRELTGQDRGTTSAEWTGVMTTRSVATKR